MPVTDEECAAQAIATLAVLSAEQQEAKSNMEALLSSGDEDSFIDIHELFALFNTLYFESKLAEVELSWSNRLTLYPPRIPPHRPRS
jgi:hypothetical protein